MTSITENNYLEKIYSVDTKITPNRGSILGNTEIPVRATTHAVLMLLCFQMVF